MSYVHHVLNEKQVLGYGKECKMDDMKDLIRQRNTLMAKLTVRDCQYEIAIEGLKTIRDSNDPMNIAEKTIDAMMDCIPDNLG